MRLWCVQAAGVAFRCSHHLNPPAPGPLPHPAQARQGNSFSASKICLRHRIFLRCGRWKKGVFARCVDRVAATVFVAWLDLLAYSRRCVMRHRLHPCPVPAPGGGVAAEHASGAAGRHQRVDNNDSDCLRRRRHSDGRRQVGGPRHIRVDQRSSQPPAGHAAHVQRACRLQLDVPVRLHWRSGSDYSVLDWSDQGERAKRQLEYC